VLNYPAKIVGDHVEGKGKSVYCSYGSNFKLMVINPLALELSANYSA
jgi:hypothetical protein